MKTNICIYKHTYVHTHTYTSVRTCIHIHIIRTYVIHIHTFFVVKFDTGTNLPAVIWNSLLAVAMMNSRHC
jgi:hypothetical protein